MGSQYKVILMPFAKKDLDKIMGKIFYNLKEKILSLSEDPRPIKAKKLIGGTSQWRIAVGRYRILYEIDDEEKIVKVFRIKHRREAYR